MSLQQRTRHRGWPIVAALALLAVGCNGGLRPTLVADDAPTAEPPLVLELTPAPRGTLRFQPTTADFPLEASVDDALVSWASDRAIPYVDSCALITPDPGQLCDVATERETVRLLGPSSTEIWYVVTLSQAESFDFGTGYRVSDVRVAGE